MRLWLNSKYVEKGDYYLVNNNNKKYVDEAIKNGAVKIITELDDTYDIDYIRVPSIKDYLYNNYKDIINKLTIIGITGTNGKTTTCYLIYQILLMMNINTCYLGTIGFYIESNIYKTDNTTPSIDLLYNMLLYAYNKNIKVFVMEVSSHALKQDRVHGILYDAIGVTNVTKEHLDYHKTMDDYINTKRKLVTLTKNKKICILNGADKYYKLFINKNNNNLIINKDIKIKNIKRNIDSVYFKLVSKRYKKGFNLNLVGDFNIYNFVMAYSIVKLLGYKIDDNKLINLKEPKGRMEKIIYNNNSIFIDYAHTPDAVLNVLKTVCKIKNKGIITIIGCGGNRDKTKRPVMANIACKYSKHVIFTNDNPRLEDEKNIINDMLKGAKDNYEVIYNRHDAIEKGISLLKKDNILLVLGKGHETYQIIGDTTYPFDDYKTVLHLLSIHD